MKNLNRVEEQMGEQFIQRQADDDSIPWEQRLKWNRSDGGELANEEVEIIGKTE